MDKEIEGTMTAWAHGWKYTSYERKSCKYRYMWVQHMEYQTKEQLDEDDNIMKYGMNKYTLKLIRNDQVEGIWN